MSLKNGDLSRWCECGHRKSAHTAPVTGIHGHGEGCAVYKTPQPACWCEGYRESRLLNETGKGYDQEEIGPQPKRH